MTAEALFQKSQKGFGSHATLLIGSQYVLEAFDAGADGYCTKDASLKELMMAIDSVSKGITYISPGFADNVLEGYLKIKTLKNQNRLRFGHPKGTGGVEASCRRAPQQGNRRAPP